MFYETHCIGEPDPQDLVAVPMAVDCARRACARTHTQVVCKSIMDYCFFKLRMRKVDYGSSRLFDFFIKLTFSVDYKNVIVCVIFTYTFIQQYDSRIPFSIHFLIDFRFLPWNFSLFAFQEFLQLFSRLFCSK